jgi:uncharacterized protein YkvS
VAKYRAKVDMPPFVKAGDIINVEEELTPEFAARVEPVDENEEVTELENLDTFSDPKTEENQVIVNPDRNALKAKATNLGITFASNIPTDRLIELISEAEAKNNEQPEGGEQPEEKQPEGDEQPEGEEETSE